LELATRETLSLARKAEIDEIGVIDFFVNLADAQGITAEYGPDAVQAALARARSAKPTQTIDPPEKANGRALVIARASEIELKPVEWLWPRRAALGKLTLIAGEPGLGKSQLTVSLAATVTTGGQWPCATDRAPRGSVVILSAEDDASDTIAPRLKAAGADLNRVQLVSAVNASDGKTTSRRSFNLQTDLDLLERAMRQVGDVRLVVIDPITSYLGKGVDSHKNAEVRSVLEPVAEMAARWQAAVIGVTHFSKGGGTSAINRFIGSIAFIAAARAAFVVTADPDSEDDARRLFLPVKNNLAAKGEGLSFRIEQHLLENDLCPSVIRWGDVVTQTADEILAATAEAEDSPRRTEAEDFLRSSLADGPKPTKDIEAEAQGAGISWRTVCRAKHDVGIKAKAIATPRDGGDGPPINRWYWSLPDDSAVPRVPPNPQECHALDVASLDSDGTLGGDGGEL
jgi:putative DNA primase/helicase